MASMSPVFACIYGVSKAGKCLAGDQEVLLADGCLMRIDAMADLLDKGATVTVRAVYEQAPWSNWALIEVRRAMRTGVKPLVRLQTVGGKVLKATPNHPLLVGSPEHVAPGASPWSGCEIVLMWAPAGSLLPGDRIAVWSSAGQPVAFDKVASVSSMPAEPTFDIEVPTAHTFVANGILVHNSSDAIYSFPDALFIAKRAALKPAEWIGAPELRIRDIEDIEELTKFLRGVKVAPRAPNHFPVIVVDDFSLMADTTFARLEKTHVGFKLWGALRDVIIDLRTAARNLGCHMILNAHESAPRTYAGRFIRGGPKLPGTLPEDFPAAADMVLRVQASPAEGRIGWPAAFRCSVLEQNYITGDRTDIVYDWAPLNTAELMRAAGFVLPHPEPWMPDVVEKLSSYFAPHLADAAAIVPMLQRARELIAGKYTQDPRRIRWALRDAVDRAVIRVSRVKEEYRWFGGEVPAPVQVLAPAPSTPLTAPPDTTRAS